MIHTNHSRYSCPITSKHSRLNTLLCQTSPSTRSGLSTGTCVKIKKGQLKGCLGRISSCTNDGIYFIQIILNDGRETIDFIPDGPYLRSEFEVIKSSA